MIDIIGNGNFGLFLRKIFSPHVEISESSYIKILAIPFSAYGEVVEKIYRSPGSYKHIVNVCSIQEPTNEIIYNYFAKNFTGIHPMFGSRSPETGRASIITYQAGRDKEIVLELFSRVSEIYYLDAKTHDLFMAKTHVKVVQLADQINEIVKDAQDIPDFVLPNSFKKLREFSETFLDMPKGTKESILANTYITNEKR